MPFHQHIPSIKTVTGCSLFPIFLGGKLRKSPTYLANNQYKYELTKIKSKNTSGREEE
jgi:hypothetical protein